MYTIITIININITNKKTNKGNVLSHCWQVKFGGFKDDCGELKFLPQSTARYDDRQQSQMQPMGKEAHFAIN